MKDVLMATLRNKDTPRRYFREAANKLSMLLAIESGALLEKESCIIETPVEQTTGVYFHKPVILVPILRAGLALLPAFLEIYPEAEVGFIGAKRDEETALPELYYENIPNITKDHVILLLDPMLATGGSLLMAIERLKAHGAKEPQIIVMSLVGAPEGVENLMNHTVGVRFNVLQMDIRLNEHKFICPGLGDFGDRYFG